MSAGIVTVTGRKASITKSRAGHYTASVKEIGTWVAQDGGRVYPYEKRVLHETLLELDQARAAIRHLDNVLNNCRNHVEQQSADAAARDWLVSIGN